MPIWMDRKGEKDIWCVYVCVCTRVGKVTKHTTTTTTKIGYTENKFELYKFGNDVDVG